MTENIKPVDVVCVRMVLQAARDSLVNSVVPSSPSLTRDVEMWERILAALEKAQAVDAHRLAANPVVTHETESVSDKAHAIPDDVRDRIRIALRSYEEVCELSKTLSDEQEGIDAVRAWLDSAQSESRAPGVVEYTRLQQQVIQAMQPEPDVWEALERFRQAHPDVSLEAYSSDLTDYLVTMIDSDVDGPAGV